MQNPLFIVSSYQFLYLVFNALPLETSMMYSVVVHYFQLMMDPSCRHSGISVEHSSCICGLFVHQKYFPVNEERYQQIGVGIKRMKGVVADRCILQTHHLQSTTAYVHKNRIRLLCSPLPNSLLSQERMLHTSTLSHTFTNMGQGDFLFKLYILPIWNCNGCSSFSSSSSSFLQSIDSNDA